MGRVQISRREHINQELTDFFYGTPSFGFGSDEKYSPVEFDLPENLLGHIDHANSLLTQLSHEIAVEFADPSKRVHGRHYTQNGRMYRWDAKEKELIRVQTYYEEQFAKEFLSSQNCSNVHSRNHHTCRFKREYSQDSTWSLCSYHGKCGNKERLTSVHCGSFGRDWFCGPTTK